ncbi:translocase of chloroplast 159, chloroplastic-like [Heracleum sosnowskyi]|uniref:Translocase of chloroplast 159, chloroplastic-like n=1 Tax=Heracleum sosnowskyi TaxID=360622 RepID=A0AAD8IG15_9APIA|nr:translocase of chloroplast 159, chloroplastic-like [Heracleum sosnowskyi]
MDSTETAANLMGSSDSNPGSLKSSSSLYLDKNVIDSDVLKVDDNDSISTISDGGFVSGEEDFEIEKPVLADKLVQIKEIKTVAVVDSGDPFVASPDYATPVFGGDEKTYKDVVLEGGVGGLSDGVGGNVGNVGVDEGVKEDKVIEVSEAEEVLVEDKKIEGLSGVEGGSEVVEKHVVESGESEEVSVGVVESSEGVEVTREGDVVVESINVDVLKPGVAVVGEMEGNGTVNGSRSLDDESDELNGGIVEEGSDQNIVVPTDSESLKLKEKSDEVSLGIVEEGSVQNVVVPTDSESLGLSNKSDEASTGTVEENSVQQVIAPTNSELVELDGVKFTPDGDSVVEDIQVKLAVPGVAVVGEEGKEVDGAVGSNTEPEQVFGDDVTSVQDGNSEQLGVDTAESTSSADVKTTPEGDVVVENIEVDVLKPGVAVVGKVEENGQADGYVENIQVNEKEPVTQGEGDAKPNDELANYVDELGAVSSPNSVGADAEALVGATDAITSIPANLEDEDHKQSEDTSASVQDEMIENGVSENVLAIDSGEPNPLQNKELEITDEMNFEKNEASEDDVEGSGSDGESDGMLFGSSEAAKQFIEELERGSEGGSNSGAESSHNNAQRIDGQIATDSDEEDTDEGEGREMFDSAALTALLKAATGAGSDGSNITITPSQDGSRLIAVERPAGLGSSMQSLRPAPRANRSNFLAPSNFSGGEESENLNDEEKSKLEKLQSIRVKFLRILKRLGVSSDESIPAQVLYRLTLIAGRQTGQLFSLDTAKQTALQLEEDGKEDLDFSVNILVLGKSGVGKSATINAIFGEEKARIDAFQPATNAVKEIIGVVDGVKIRVLDTPGLKTSVMEQSFNRSILSSVKKFTKKNPVDVVLYVDRLDAQTRDLNDLPLLRTITSSLGSPIWRSAIVTLTHAASAPPEGPSGSPLSYDAFVTQRSHVLQLSIGQSVNDIRMMSPGLMNMMVSLVENHASCRKTRGGQKVLPNGHTWRPELMMLCYSMKILLEANSLSKPQELFDQRKLFGFRTRSPPLPYMLSSMLQSRPHPKLSTEQGGDNGDSDIDLADLSDSDQEDEDEYDQLPPFKPLKKSQLAKLSKDQRKAYFEEYDYRVKLLQKKQWREELKRMKEMKKKGKDSVNDSGYTDEDPDAGSAAAPVSVPLPDMALPPSFDSDNPAHRYRFLEPTSQFLARPVLDTHGWDHDCGYEGVNIEQSLAILSQFPSVISVQLTKDKKEFSINLDSSIAAKHGENGSSMAGFDIQNMGKQLAYIIRGETKFKNFRKNKTAAGVSVTFLGENVVTGLKVEDQISFGKQYSLVASAGTVRSQQDVAYGANIEMQRRELEYPIGQVQSSLGLSLIKWKGDLALGFNSIAQFSIGRNSKVAVRAGINNKLTGQISVRTSSSEHLSLALASILPAAITIYKKLYPDVGEKYIY